MEVATVIALAGLGYLVTQGTSSPSKAKPTPTPTPKKTKEGFQSFAYPSPPGSPYTQTKSGNSFRGSVPEYDQRFENVMGKTYPAQPYPPSPPNKQPTDFAGPTRSFANLNGPALMNPGADSLESVRPSMAMNPSGVESNPIYVEGNDIISPLSGVKMSTKDFTHNNMQPFYGGSIKQNMAPDTNQSILDSFTGSGVTQIQKREVEPMFDSQKAPFGNPFGMEDNTEFFQSRMDDPALRRRDGERPFEPVRVASAIGEQFGATGKGGFQQFEVNDFMMKNIRRTDDLRTADNPKTTFTGVVVPGQQFIGKPSDNPGEVRKYRPDAFYIDQGGERFIGAFAEEHQAETSRPIQVMPYTTRTDTTTEIIGPASSQEFGESYVTGTYRTPMAQQYGGAGYRNADMTGYYTKDMDSPEADYGKGSYEIRPNERLFTSERTMGLNLTPADTGLTSVHFDDDARPTRRAEMVGNIRQTGTPTGYAGGAPAITVWDPSDVARTTVKETTIKWDYRGIAAPADGPTKLKVYDPDDIARPTQKAQISAKSEYYGGPKASTEKFTSHQSAYNMRTNPNKEQIAKGRKPFAGNGGMGVLNGDPGRQTSKKLNADIINDRALAQNRVDSMSLPPGAGDIGEIKYRAPLKLDISLERNMPIMVEAVNDNPLQQSLQRNAQHDERLLEEYLTQKRF